MVDCAATLTRAASRLKSSTDAPRLEAELLLTHVLGLSRAELYAHPERPLLAHQLNSYRSLVTRRAHGEPLPHLTGHIEFYGLDLAVDSRVLIPRPETETLVDLALPLVSSVQPGPGTDGRRLIADVGTGSGCIAIALAVHAPQSLIYALDLSPEALAVARANAKRHRVADRVAFLQSDLLTSLPEPVDLVVANPPYIADDEWPLLPRDVREYEPRLALHGGCDGKDVIRRLLQQTPAHLRSGGVLLLEIGATQGVAVTSLAHQVFPTADVTLHTDLSGRDRVLCIKTDGQLEVGPAALASTARQREQ
jgi:release factor glutamine methyltransferase